MAWPFCEWSAPAETDSVNLRPSRVSTRRSAETTRPPRAISRQRNSASIALWMPTNS